MLHTYTVWEKRLVQCKHVCVYVLICHIRPLFLPPLKYYNCQMGAGGKLCILLKASRKTVCPRDYNEGASFTKVAILLKAFVKLCLPPVY